MIREIKAYQRSWQEKVQKTNEFQLCKTLSVRYWFLKL